MLVYIIDSFLDEIYRLCFEHSKNGIFGQE